MTGEETPQIPDYWKTPTNGEMSFVEFLENQHGYGFSKTDDSEREDIIENLSKGSGGYRVGFINHQTGSITVEYIPLDGKQLKSARKFRDLCEANNQLYDEEPTRNEVLNEITQKAQEIQGLAKIIV